MKTKVISLICAAASVSLAHSQNLIAHWDFNDGQSANNSLIPEASPHSCITPSNVGPTSNYSWSTGDSETGVGLGANCFGGWSSTEYVSFEVTAHTNAVGNINQLTFDIANYGGANDPDQFKVGAYQNNVLISQTGWMNITGLTTQGSGVWTGTPGQSISYSNLSTSAGSGDVFEFRIMANQDSGRIALDNARLFGDITCVPEPSTTFLGALVLISATFQRRR